MPVYYDASGYPTYVDDGTSRLDDDFYLHPVVPPRPSRSPSPSPRGSPNLAPMYLDQHYQYIQPGTGYVGVPMIPAGIMPLPPSPSMLSATFVPLPPSPRVSPRHNPIPLSPISPGGMLGAYPYPQQQYAYDPYYFSQQASPMYMNPQLPPRTSLHPLLKDDGMTRIDLSAATYKAETPSGSWVSRKYIPIHEGYLVQVASYPAVTEVKLVCKALGAFADKWAIRIRLGRTISVGDVLKEIYAGLHTPVTHEEWARMTEAEIYEAGRQYTRRCRTADFERTKGVRRVDLLGKKHWFAGLKKVKNDDPYHFEILVKSE